MSLFKYVLPDPPVLLNILPVTIFCVCIIVDKSVSVFVAKFAESDSVAGGYAVTVATFDTDVPETIPGYLT